MEITENGTVSTMTPILELKGITKRFPGVLANDHIDLSLNKGEILALLGENGAGKSTLMNILYGLYQPDEGEILVMGKSDHQSPTDARIKASAWCISTSADPVFTVTENVMLGNEAEEAVSDRKSRRSHPEIPNTTTSENPDDHLGFPVGVQWRVEIIATLP